MKKEKYAELFKRQEELKRKILLAFSELSAGHVTEDHVQEQHVINHVVEDHYLQYHVTIEDQVEDYPDR